jgi:ribulose-phosphate 3-epimerase
MLLLWGCHCSVSLLPVLATKNIWVLRGNLVLRRKHHFAAPLNRSFSMTYPLIAPSLLAANFLKLESEIDLVHRSDADWLHLDIMDGRFVPNISFGLPVLASIRQATNKLFDVHLMIEEPGKYAEDFKHVGADILTVHYEACPHLHRNIEQIKKLDMKAGVAINPATPVSVLADIIADVDLVCLMSVNPGFGGQKFIEHTLNKIHLLRQIIDMQDLKVEIEIDGGVTLQNAPTILEAGATVLVAGNTVFGASNPIEVISRLKALGVG